MKTRRGEPLAYLLAHLSAMPTDCTAWPFAHRDGYGQLRLDGERWAVHRLVCEWYHGPPLAGQECLHSCGNGHLGCFTPAHLRWGGAADNGRDRALHGVLRGERNGRSKLTTPDVEDIRRRVQAGELQVHLARAYGVSPYTIGSIVRGKRWTNRET